MENNLSHLLYFIFFVLKLFFFIFHKKIFFFFLPHVWKVEWLKKYVRKKNICVIYGKNLQGINSEVSDEWIRRVFFLLLFFGGILSNSHIGIYRLVYKVVMVTKSPPQILIGCACLLPKINELYFSYM